MALMSIAVPNLISGVSQQPPALRLSTAAQFMDNCWPSVISGLNKRPNTEAITSIMASLTAGSLVGHIIDRATDYHYIVTINNAVIRVFDLSGVEQTVTTPNGNAYLVASDEAKSFRFLTIQDTTFILNREFTVVDDPFRETGAVTFTPYGTAATVVALPVASITTVGRTYVVTADGLYYQCQLTSGSPQIINWVFTSSSTTIPATISIRYEPIPAVGTTVYERINSLTGGSSGGGGGGTYIYKLYTVAVTQVAVSPVYAWVIINVSSVATKVNGRINPVYVGTVYVMNSVANSYYSIYINNLLVATMLSNTGTDAATSVQSTTAIANTLATSLGVAGKTCTVLGSTISITGLAPTDTLAVTGTQGDKALKCYRDAIASFSDLPPTDVEGRVVKVKGSDKDNGDDYYVIMKSGIWTETYAYGEGGGIKSDTMPHVLVRNLDGTWSFKNHVWLNRLAGSIESNPTSSFIGEKITDLYLFTNRLGFLTGSNVIVSEANNYENFYRTTLATLIDSDRLDFSVLSAMNDSLQHAVPFNKDILLLADRSQHRLTYNNFVGPKNVEVRFTTSFNCSPNVKPINMGGSVYFADDKTGYTFGKALEYFPKPNYTGDDAEETTAPVPQFIKAGMTFLAGSPRLNIMVAASNGEPTKLYLHKFFWSGDRKVQNSWSTWSFPDCIKVHWAGFTRNYMVLLIQRTGGVFLERVRIDEDLYSITNGSRVLLDRLTLSSAKTYSSGTGLTTITTPYTSVNPVQLVIDGQWSIPTRVSSTQVTVIGNVTTSDVWCGIAYDKVFEFSTPYIRYTKGQGEVVSLDGRLQMRYLTLEYHNTPYFKVAVTTGARPEFTRVIDQPTQSGKLRVALVGNHTDLRVCLINDSPFNSAFGLADWQALYQPKAKPVR